MVDKPPYTTNCDKREKMFKKIPIGKSNFKAVIEDEDYFVDKTLFIKEVIDCSSQTSLVLRPRRFGKTLNLSMLRYFFTNSESNANMCWQNPHR